jgi:hypothetical protein
MNDATREKKLNEQLKRIEKLEREIVEREKAIKDKESTRKQIVLRLSPALWSQIASWAEDDFRSINSQIEFLLSEAVESRAKMNGRKT